MTKPRRLTWKYEDGDGTADSDVGPAWMSAADGSTESVNEGEWLTRAQARALAEEHDYEFLEDDGRGEPNPAPPLADAVNAINRKLRRLGVSRDDLDLSAGQRDVFLMGAWYHRVDDHPLVPRDNPFGFRAGGASMSLEDALSKIRRLIPDWDDTRESK